MTQFRTLVLSASFALISLGVCSTASAQYRNQAFGIDVGGWLITKPTVLNEQRTDILPLDNRPLRLANGLRIGGETNYKMDEDHWWFTGRVNIGFLNYAASSGGNPLEREFDQAARDSLGVLLGVQGSIGARYVFLTDRFRPYLQIAGSYLRLFSFTSAADQDCTTGGCTGGTNQSNFLPHANVGGFHLQPGVELVFTRDVAFHFFADLQRWIVFNAEDNVSIVLGAGFVFFT